jgi:hypothetical protein
MVSDIWELVRDDILVARPGPRLPDHVLLMGFRWLVHGIASFWVLVRLSIVGAQLRRLATDGVSPCDQ